MMVSSLWPSVSASKNKNKNFSENSPRNFQHENDEYLKKKRYLRGYTGNRHGI